MFWLCLLILHISLLHFDTMFLHKMLLEVYTTKRTIWPMYVMILNNLLDLWRIGPRIRSNGRALLAASLTSLKHNALELLYGMQLLLCYNIMFTESGEERRCSRAPGFCDRKVAVYGPVILWCRIDTTIKNVLSHFAQHGNLNAKSRWSARNIMAHCTK